MGIAILYYKIQKNYNTYSSPIVMHESGHQHTCPRRDPERDEEVSARFINWNQEIRDFIQKRVDDKKDDRLAAVTGTH